MSCKFAVAKAGKVIVRDLTYDQANSVRAAFPLGEAVVKLDRFDHPLIKKLRKILDPAKVDTDELELIVNDVSSLMTECEGRYKTLFP